MTVHVYTLLSTSPLSLYRSDSARYLSTIAQLGPGEAFVHLTAASGWWPEPGGGWEKYSRDTRRMFWSNYRISQSHGINPCVFRDVFLTWRYWVMIKREIFAENAALFLRWGLSYGLWRADMFCHSDNPLLGCSRNLKSFQAYISQKGKIIQHH